MFIWHKRHSTNAVPRSLTTFKNTFGITNVCSKTEISTFIDYQLQLQGSIFLISNFRRVLNVVCFLLGNFLASEFYMPTFQNTVSVPSL